MGYFSRLSALLFKTTGTGESIFYPYGAVGSGYILSQEDENKIRSFLKRYFSISIPVIILGGLIFQILTLILLAVAIPVYYVMMTRSLANADETQEKLTMSEVRTNIANSIDRQTCFWAVIVSLLMTVLSVFVLLASGNKVLPFLGIIVFGFCSWHLFLMYDYFEKKHQ